MLVGIGKLAATSLEAAKLLEQDGLDVTVLDPRVVRPFDPALVERCRNARLVVTAEDGLVHGGAGQHLRGVLERAAELVSERPPSVLCLGVPTVYVGHADPDVILQRLELDASGIAASTRTASERLIKQAGNGAGRVHRREAFRAATSPSVRRGRGDGRAMNLPVEFDGATRATPVVLDTAVVMAKAGAENFPVATAPAAGTAPRAAARDLRLRPLRRRRRRSRCRATGSPSSTGWRPSSIGRFCGAASHPVFVAVGRLAAEIGVGRSPFVDLIEANRQDQVATRYPSYEALEAYCALSANPVGRLVLAVFGRRDAALGSELSDRVCTALQLVEHFQDVAEDFAAGRVYLPAEDLTRFGVDESALAAGSATPACPAAHGLRGGPRPAAPRCRDARSSRSFRMGPRRGRRVSSAAGSPSSTPSNGTATTSCRAR